uniref:Uncharacterized protein n=1 Tax=Oryza brachyantha TaxID=4533 RepID=J3L6R7_ORYBR
MPRRRRSWSKSREERSPTRSHRVPREYSATAAALIQQLAAAGCYCQIYSEATVASNLRPHAAERETATGALATRRLACIWRRSEEEEDDDDV